MNFILDIRTTTFPKHSIVDVWQGSEYTRVLNKPGLWIWLRFWICWSFDYARVLSMPLVLNIPGLWIYEGFEYTRITQGFEYAWIVPENTWLCLNVSEYAWISLNLSEWLLFYFSPLKAWFLISMFTRT